MDKTRKEISSESDAPHNDVMICRCEEITREEIITAIRAGRHTVDSIRRALRAGMGACQGRTCGRLIMNLLLEEGVQTHETLAYAKARFPLVPLPVDAMQPPAENILGIASALAASTQEEPPLQKEGV